MANHWRAPASPTKLAKASFSGTSSATQSRRCAVSWISSSASSASGQWIKVLSSGSLNQPSVE